MNYNFNINDELFIFDGNSLNLYKDTIPNELDERIVLKNEEKKLYKCTIIVTERCNGSCVYCYEKDWDYKRVMNKDTAMNIVRSILENYNTVGEICFFGGEATLNFKVIKEIVEELYGKIEVHEYRITTNATLITDEMIAFFEKYKFKVVISLDGPAFIHDELRKGLPHYKVIDVINKIKKTNIRNKLMINCTYTKYHEENIGTNKLHDYFQKLGVKYEINNVITDNVDMQLANIKNQSEEQCIIETYEKLANKPLEFKGNMYCNAIIEALVEHIYKEKFCYELCSEYGLTFKADGKKILCNSFNDIENYNYAEAMNLNSKSHKECLDCWARGMCVECVANHMLDRKNIPYGSDGCKKKKKYAFALEKIVEIMYYDEEKFQKIINNYYNYR